MADIHIIAAVHVPCTTLMTVMRTILPLSYSNIHLNSFCLRFLLVWKGGFSHFPKAHWLQFQGPVQTGQSYRMYVCIHLLEGKILSNLKPSESFILLTVDIEMM